jgi:hypothetical protein
MGTAGGSNDQFLEPPPGLGKNGSPEDGLRNLPNHRQAALPGTLPVVNSHSRWPGSRLSSRGEEKMPFPGACAATGPQPERRGD